MKKERKLHETKNSKPSVYELKDQQEGNKNKWKNCLYKNRREIKGCVNENVKMKESKN